MLNMNALAQMAQKMAPNLKINEAVKQASQMTQGTTDSLEAVRKKAQEIGLNKDFVENIYNQYGNSPQIKGICKMLGTTPEAIKRDADKVLNGGGMSSMPTAKNSGTSRFPRLK